MNGGGMISETKYDRQVLFFGKDGQEKIRSAIVTVVGVGGVGSHIIQQLAFLGIGTII